MSGRGFRVTGVRLWCAAAASALLPGPLLAQSPAAPAPPATDPAELDPNAPLAPMPDLGVDWPDLNAKESEPASQPPDPEAVKAAPDLTTEAGGTLRYVWQVDGLSSVGSASDLPANFRKQSTLEAERKKAANAAQIGRRASADAEVVTQLLRSMLY